MEHDGDNEVDEAVLAPGYRFYPTEEELITFYLHNKLEGNKEYNFNHVIPVISIYDFDPWQLPEIAGEMCNGDKEQWFFFTPRQEREARGGRPNRTTCSGYWKATGSPGYVYSSSSSSSSSFPGCNNGNRIIGMKKTMVFYTGKAPTGTKTKWKMNEYRAIVRVGEHHDDHTQTSTSSDTTPMLRHEFSLCRVYVKSGCLRAFDRRPLVESMSISDHQQKPIDRDHQGVNGDGTTTTTLFQVQSSSMNTTILPNKTTSLGKEDKDQTVTVVSGETSTDNWEMMADDLDPLWEWEQLKWN